MSNAVRLPLLTMMHSLKIFIALITIGISGWLLTSVAAQPQATKVDFQRDIAPIFAAHCAGCHGAAKTMSGLRLDDKKLALRVIAAGDSKNSRLVHRLLGEGGEARMPMNGAPLKGEQIALIKRWIDEGAVWPEDKTLGTGSDKGKEPVKHWAFAAPTRPALPAVKNKAWARTPLDHFILAELEKQKLTPAPEADKATLIRRLSLDLLGLPPTIAEIDQFVADRSPDAYEKLVERLLASPHYGERWGRHWLDAARYADTNGFEKDRDRSIWPYRDWVIKAFNDDKPFDQFTIEQLAGDLLPNATLQQRVATGFLRNSMLNEEGAVEPEVFRIEGVMDRVDAVGKAFLGLTINCAQCHSHKYDPIRHDEYYQFYAFLNNDDEPELEVPDAKIEQKRAEILAGIRRVEDELLAKHPDMPQRLAAWEEKVKADAGQWTVLQDISVTGASGIRFERLLDDSFIPRGDNPPTTVYTATAKTNLQNITGFRLELLTDYSLPRGGPGRGTDGNAWLSEFTVRAAPADQTDKDAKPELLTISRASADFSAAADPVKQAIDGSQKTSWGIDAGPGLRNQDRQAVFVLQKPTGYAAGTKFTIQLSQKQYDGGREVRYEAPNIGRFRLAVTTTPDPRADAVPSRVRRILNLPAHERSPEQQREVFSFYRTTVTEFAEANRAASDLMKQWPYGATTLAITPRAVPRETHVFKRGDWKRPGELVTPGTPSFLHPFHANAPRNRLGLALWLTDKNNPLTSRVIVNRIWQQYFGQGLVVSPEDFGTRAETPSHPELLDWLAVEFREGRNSTGSGSDRVGSSRHNLRDHPLATARGTDSGAWRWKHVHRLIVNSATYRQASVIPTSSSDPTNRYLARAPRLRVEAEIIRDIALTASGLLIGGPSVYPPIPDGALAVSFRSRSVWETSKGEDRYRRGLYTFWKRSVPYPAMSTFDAPNADVSCTRRTRSVSPLQALTTLNDQVFMETAQAFALRVWKEGGTDDRAKMIYAFRLSTARPPDDFELRRLLTLLEQQRARFAGQTAAAVYVSAQDLNDLPPGIDLHQLAPWTMVARVLLNLDETITRQ
jgi:mono/diheme cytochrome c family protein